MLLFGKKKQKQTSYYPVKVFNKPVNKLFEFFGLCSLQFFTKELTEENRVSVVLGSKFRVRLTLRSSVAIS